MSFSYDFIFFQLVDTVFLVSTEYPRLVGFRRIKRFLQ